MLDGHGQNGTQSSMFVKMKLSNFITDHILKAKESNKKVISEPDPEEKDDPNFDIMATREEKIITHSLYNSLIQTQNEIEQNGSFNVQLSGTTVTSAFFSGNQLYTANVGDSRTILISMDETDPKSIKVRQLTTDHKPDFDAEKKRVIQCGGRVAQAMDFRGRMSGPLRVWGKNMNSPGLAMSRSIGDCVAHSVGCACEPDISHTILSSLDKIILLASDGIWEFLTNMQVANIVFPYL